MKSGITVRQNEVVRIQTSHRLSVRGVQLVFVRKLEILQNKPVKNLPPPPVVNEVRAKVTVE